MSKHNKANKSNYVQAGRLTPDDMARERSKMRTLRGGGDQIETTAGRVRTSRAATGGSERATSAAPASRTRRSGREE